MDHGAIDLHNKESQIRIITNSGEIVDRRIVTARDGFTQVFWGRPRMRILVEASTESEWVAQHLEQLGHEVIVADPNYAPMHWHRSRRIKTDRRDVWQSLRPVSMACRALARTRVHLQAAGWLTPRPWNLACSSIAGRRASGFLQVSLSRVSRY